MRHSPALRDFVSAWEGCKLKPYEDVIGVWTVGYGHVLLPDEQRCTWTQARADEQLDMDLADHGERLSPFIIKVSTQQQFDALLSLAFNCGISGIGNSGLMTCHNNGDFMACANRFRLWKRAGGHDVPGLLKRREAERTIYLYGIYTGRP